MAIKNIWYLISLTSFYTPSNFLHIGFEKIALFLWNRNMLSYLTANVSRESSAWPMSRAQVWRGKRAFLAPIVFRDSFWLVWKWTVSVQKERGTSKLLHLIFFLVEAGQEFYDMQLRAATFSKRSLGLTSLINVPAFQSAMKILISVICPAFISVWNIVRLQIWGKTGGRYKKGRGRIGYCYAEPLLKKKIDLQSFATTERWILANYLACHVISLAQPKLRLWYKPRR